MLDVNHATEKLTGYSHSELVGRSILDLVTKDSAGIVSEKMLSSSKELFEVVALRKDGSTFAAEIYSTPYQTPETQLRSASIRDISSQKQAENALNQAKKMEAVGQLTGGIAHDFNNLLSVIRGNLRFLKKDIGDRDSLKNLFDDALSAVGDGEKLTQRLLTFSRHRALHIEDTNVNDAVEGFARFLSRSLVDTMVLNCELPDESCFIDVDQSQLQHALLNLSFNARDAMCDGGVITYRVERTQGDQSTLPQGAYICISVTDTGRGISAENLLKVYEPFFTTKAIGSGSGLGLSMVWGFVQQSRGACHIESKIGKGTSVKMYFPELRKNRIQNDSLEINRQRVVKGKYTILVVEDEHRVRRVTSTDLRNIGYSVVEAEDAAMAKSILESEEHAIDLVFSDVIMPGELDGHMLVKWVRKTYPDIKVILTSGYSIGKAVDNSIVLECPLITKPYTIDNLSEELRTALETIAPLL